MTYTYVTSNLDIAAFLLHEGFMPSVVRKHTFTTKYGAHRPSSEFTFELPEHPDSLLERWEASPINHYVECRVALKRSIQKLFKSPLSHIAFQKGGDL